MREIIEKIKRLKQEQNAIILAHSYQRPEVQDIGDYVGDSLGLCLEAAKTDADVIVFCGVHFMAESAKLLNPLKKVLLPEIDAGCPMADMVTAQSLRKLKAEYPGAAVVCYINSTAAVKAESDICCTSSNAVKIARTIDPEREIIFVPDKHLGRYAGEQAGRQMILWPGFCPTHQRILAENIIQLKQEYPDALVFVHPECTREVVALADFVGSTEAIFRQASAVPQQQFIIGTELGILHRLKKANPAKEFIPATELSSCRNMKKIDLYSVLEALEQQKYEIEIDPALADAALRPIQRMMEVS